MCVVHAAKSQRVTRAQPTASHWPGESAKAPAQEGAYGGRGQMKFSAVWIRNLSADPTRRKEEQELWATTVACRASLCAQRGGWVASGPVVVAPPGAQSHLCRTMTRHAPRMPKSNVNAVHGTHVLDARTTRTTAAHAFREASHLSTVVIVRSAKTALDQSVITGLVENPMGGNEDCCRLPSTARHHDRVVRI